jgi:soluble lytic murein transglycosylase-like protein
MQPRLFITAIALCALTTTAWAGERVTLRNSFEMHCDHHVESEGRVRLYLSTGEDNYIEFAPGEIAGIEQVADPPPPALAKQPAADQATARTEPTAQKEKDTKLSPADLHEMLAKAGVDHNLDVDLLASLVKAESGGNARAVSRAGARGLMQLMPGTAAELGVGDSFKPEQNVRGGSTYLDALLIHYHNNLALALAAYNAGPAAVDKYHGIPPYHDTRAYVARVIHEFNRRVLAREAQAKQAIASASNSQDVSVR